MSEIVRKSTVKDGVLYSQTIQDPTETLDQNKAERNERSSIQKYRGNLSHVGRIDLAFIEQMRNGQCCPDGTSYNLMSSDVEEKRRALVHIQDNHPYWLTVDGKPFSKNRVKWQ